jgi:hypothetical protein
VALDPSRQWLAAGITGLARRREWDAVVTTDALGSAGDEVELVALPDRAPLVERTTAVVDVEPLVEALDRVLERPYRALCVRRPELWVLGAVTLDTVELADARGTDIEVVRDVERAYVRIDGLPTADRVPELERLGSSRGTAFVVRARRLVASTFEVEIEAL